MGYIQQHWRVAFGNIIEWYDYCLYGFLAKPLADTFFPVASSSIVWVWLIFFLGLSARLVGGMYYGSRGDRQGHQASLTRAVNGIALPTVVIGCLPTYSQVGLWSTLALLVLRIWQGFCAGGQYTGALTVMSTRDKASVFRGVAFSNALATAGIILASMVLALINWSGLSASWVGWWRIGFWLSAILAVVFYFSPGEKHNSTSDCPASFVSIKALWTDYRHACFQATLLLSISGLLYYGIFIYFLNYMIINLHYSSELVYSINVVALILTSIFPFVVNSYLAKIERYAKMQLLYGMILINGVVGGGMVFAGSSVMVLAGYLLLTTPVIISYILSVSYALEIFPKTVRYRAISLSYNIGYGVVGGIAPLLLSVLVNHYKSPWILYVMLFSIVFCGIILLLLIRYRLRDGAICPLANTAS